MADEQKARVKVASSEIDQVNKVCEEIEEIAEKTGVEMSGPVPLPTETLNITTKKSPATEGPRSWDRYEMRIHKRLIDLKADQRTLRLVMKIPIPEDLNIEIEMVE